MKSKITYLINQTFRGSVHVEHIVHGHTAPYLNESSAKALRAYGPSFGGNESFKIFVSLPKLSYFSKLSYF